MPVHVRELQTGQFHSRASGQWDFRELNEITVLFGRNGSGKSRLLRYLRDADRSARHYVSPERGGEFTFEPGLLQAELSADQRAQRRTANAAPNYRQEAVSRVQSYLNLRGLRENPPLPPRSLELLMAVLLPEFEMTIGDEGLRLIRTTNSEQVTGAAQMSSGEAAVFSVGLDLVTICAVWVLQATANGVLLIDEPDLHLHPDLQQHLAAFLAQLIETFPVQLIVATHSTTLLAALAYHGGAKTSVIFLDPSATAQKATVVGDAMRELATCLGGHALMGPLFAVPLLLVEGDDDYRVWAHAVRQHVLRAAAIPCEGARIREYERDLEQIFKAMVDPPRTLAFSLRDLDERPTTPAATGTFVRRLYLACRESENLYLTANVLALLGTVPASAREAIAAQAADFGTKADRLRTVASHPDWMKIDLKGLMEELTRILDPKFVDWRMRLGTAIGRDRPSGELATALGDDVVDNLWPVSALVS